MLIFQSNSFDIYHNLALEEYLMNEVSERGSILFLWQSNCAVVLGKNQNPWLECRLDRMRAEEIPLARRISGGGTVYHDAGNLNYCVITDRTAYREEQAFEMVLQALETLDIHAEKTGKSNLSVAGKKFSGTAFCFRRGCALHHGTLLLETNLEKLHRYLGSDLLGIETHAIRSIPAQVINLERSVTDMVTALTTQFKVFYSTDNVPALTTDFTPKPELFDLLLKKQRSNVWKYETTPKFILQQPNLYLEIIKGKVTSARGQRAEEFLNTYFSDSSFSWSCGID